MRKLPLSRTRSLRLGEGAGGEGEDIIRAVRVTGRRLVIEGVVVMVMLAGIAWLMRALPLAPPERVAAWEAESGARRVSGTVSPARLGANRVDVAYESGALIVVSFLPVGGDGVVARRTLTEASPGRYGSSGFVISRAGPWQMLVAIEQPGQSPALFTVDWEVRADGGLWRVNEPSAWPAVGLGWLNTRGAAGLSALAALLVGVWGWRVWRWRQLRI